ncbi:MAG: hypothetical protein RI885_2460, partial [Actinomycetota bacterium]
EENTLGVILGRRARGGVPAASTAGRAVVQAGARGVSLGTAHLGIGVGVIAAVAAVFGLSVFASHLGEYPSVVPVVLAWLLFIVAFAMMSLSISTRSERFPGWVFVCFAAALAGVVALDFIAIWPMGDVGTYATASIAAAFGLVMAVTLRPAHEIVIAASVLFVAFVAAVVLTTELTPENLPRQISTVALAVLPSGFGLFIIRRFRRMVQLELDRVLVQSTVSAPRFAVGMLASEELARLDLAAEELLDSVASGRTALPLGPKTASTAASLATELRLHLIEGRRETWLYHAVTESEQLGRSARLVDSGSLAGLLDPQQRDGLLAAVWLLVADNNNKKTNVTAELRLGPIASGAAATRSVVVPVVIVTTGMARNRVDPSVWEALNKVGPYASSTENASLRVEIECSVANPADQ